MTDKIDTATRDLARGLVRGSIIEDAAAQFFAQVLKHAHGTMRAERDTALARDAIGALTPPSDLEGGDA